MILEMSCSPDLAQGGSRWESALQAWLSQIGMTGELADGGWVDRGLHVEEASQYL